MAYITQCPRLILLINWREVQAESRADRNSFRCINANESPRALAHTHSSVLHVNLWTLTQCSHLITLSYVLQLVNTATLITTPCVLLKYSTTHLAFSYNYNTTCNKNNSHSVYGISVISTINCRHCIPLGLGWKQKIQSYDFKNCLKKKGCVKRVKVK